jgi:hypothetical protein
MKKIVLVGILMNCLFLLLAQEIQNLEFYNMKIGISTYNECKDILSSSTNKFISPTYYNGYFFSKTTNENTSYFRKQSDTLIDYDKDKSINTITCYFVYNDKFNKIPIQLFFFKNILFKVDVVIISTDFQKSILDEIKNHYGKPIELSLGASANNQIFGYSWGTIDIPIIMIIQEVYIASVGLPYFELIPIDEKAKGYKYYVNYFDRATQKAYYEYIKNIETTRKQEISKK